MDWLPGWANDFLFAQFWTTAGGGAVIAATIAIITLIVNHFLERKRRAHESQEKQKDRDASREQPYYQLKVEERKTTYSNLETFGEMARQAMQSLTRYKTASLTADYMEASTPYPNAEENIQRGIAAIRQDVQDSWKTVIDTQEKLAEKHSQLKMRDLKAADIALDIKIVIDRAVRETTRSDQFTDDTENFSDALTEYSRKVRAYRDSPIT